MPPPVMCAIARTSTVRQSSPIGAGVDAGGLEQGIGDSRAAERVRRVVEADAGALEQAADEREAV